MERANNELRFHIARSQESGGSVTETVAIRCTPERFLALSQEPEGALFVGTGVRIANFGPAPVVVGTQVFRRCGMLNRELNTRLSVVLNLCVDCAIAV